MQLDQFDSSRISTPPCSVCRHTVDAHLDVGCQVPNCRCYLTWSEAWTDRRYLESSSTTTTAPRTTLTHPESTPTDDRWKPLARLSTAAEAIEGLRDLFATEEPLSEVSMRVASGAVEAIEHADIVSITVLTWPDARTTAFTDDRALPLDGAQYSHGRGPCLEAAWEGTTKRAVIGDERARWPEFTAAAERIGIRASLSVPLLVGPVGQDQESVGSLNVYSLTAEAFDPFDEVLMRVYTIAAGHGITNARRWQQTRETVSQLETALTSRPEIDMAKGVLMALHGCDPVEAFERLRTESQRRNVKLHTVAQELIGYVHRPSQDSI